ncbi:unnamed protein product [Orchesella dallaii]|uniref:Uncharacterized protein n=1 Tax=Orchesella dallaii TaxID=48710 RepID=A0ABP1PWR6_9HEXA
MGLSLKRGVLLETTDDSAGGLVQGTLAHGADATSAESAVSLPKLTSDSLNSNDVDSIFAAKKNIPHVDSVTGIASAESGHNPNNTSDSNVNGTTKDVGISRHSLSKSPTAKPSQTNQTSALIPTSNVSGIAERSMASPAADLPLNIRTPNVTQDIQSTNVTNIPAAVPIENETDNASVPSRKTAWPKAKHERHNTDNKTHHHQHNINHSSKLAHISHNTKSPVGKALYKQLNLWYKAAKALNGSKCSRLDDLVARSNVTVAEVYKVYSELKDTEATIESETKSLDSANECLKGLVAELKIALEVYKQKNNLASDKNVMLV